MRKLLGNDKGYTLILTILISLMFSLIAMGLLMATFTGATRTELRQDVTQSSELAEKGALHISHEITATLEKEIQDEINNKKNAGMPASMFATRLQELLKQYLCSNVTGSKIEVNSDTGTYVACISDIQPIYNSNGEENPYMKLVTFRSIGYVDGKERELTFTMKIGSNSIPEALNYALGAHILCTKEKDCIPGEGNMFLHGGVQIQGDMKIDGNLITANRARMLLGGSQYWVESLYPAVMPTPNTKAKNARIVLGKEIYTFSPDHSFNYTTHITRSSFNTSTYTKRTQNIQQAFDSSGVPNIVVRNPSIDPVAISEERDYFKYNYNDSGVTIINATRNSNNKYIYSSTGEMYKNSTVHTRYQSCDNRGRCTDYYNLDFELHGNNSFKSFSTQKNLTINGNTNNFQTTTVTEGMYVGGDLYIGYKNTNSHNPSDYNKVRLNGTIFVDGDLYIRGANAEMNALIYVTGNVDIQYSVINGMKLKDGREGSLIIFAEGDIKISNNSVFQNEPSNIRAFFYSKQAFEMYGVGSNIKISGGISARRIVLNAIRGEVRDTCGIGCNSSNYYSYGGDYFMKRNLQEGKKARIQIIYNPEILQTYSDLKIQEPVIDKVNLPELIERQIK